MTWSRKDPRKTITTSAKIAIVLPDGRIGFGIIAEEEPGFIGTDFADHLRLTPDDVWDKEWAWTLAPDNQCCWFWKASVLGSQKSGRCTLNRKHAGRCVFRPGEGPPPAPPENRVDDGKRVQLNQECNAWRIDPKDMMNIPPVVWPKGAKGTVISVDAPEGGPEVCWAVHMDGEPDDFVTILQESKMDVIEESP